MSSACGADALVFGEPPASQSSGDVGADTTTSDALPPGRTATSVDPSGTSTTPDSASSSTTAGATTDPDQTDSAGTTDAGTTGSRTSTTDGPASSSGAPASSCGDGILDPGEECDDGNLVDVDACTASCTLAFCGDGITWQGNEECDDANLENADACTNACIERFPVIYFVDPTEAWNAWRYDVQTDSWDTLMGPLDYVVDVAWDGSNLHAATLTWNILRYDPSADTWDDGIPRPPGSDSLASQIAWIDGALYMVVEVWSAGTSPIYVWENEAWSEFSVPHNVAASIAHDDANDELYVRDFSESGFFVLDTLTNTVVREFSNVAEVPETSSPTAFLDGFVYVKGIVGGLKRQDALTGATVGLGVVPDSLLVSTAVDPYKHHVYIAGAGPYLDVLQRYDATDGSLTTLALAPNGNIPSWTEPASIALVYPDP